MLLSVDQASCDDLLWDNHILLLWHLRKLLVDYRLLRHRSLLLRECLLMLHLLWGWHVSSGGNDLLSINRGWWILIGIIVSRLGLLWHLLLKLWLGRRHLILKVWLPNGWLQRESLIHIVLLVRVVVLFVVLHCFVIIIIIIIKEQKSYSIFKHW